MRENQYLVIPGEILFDTGLTAGEKMMLSDMTNSFYYFQHKRNMDYTPSLNVFCKRLGMDLNEVQNYLSELIRKEYVSTKESEDRTAYIVH